MTQQPADATTRRLTIAFGLLAGFVVAEVVAAVVASSLALLADAGHLLTDAIALLVAIGAARLARRPPTAVWTFGFGRAEVLSAALNGVTLLVVAAGVGAEAIRRLLHPAAVDGPVVIAVAAVGLVVNLAAAGTLARGDRQSLNLAGALLHVASDAYAFAATLGAGVVIVATGWQRADAVGSLAVVAVMVRGGAHLLRRSGAVLLERVPLGVDLADLRRHLLATAGVEDVHDLHAWSMGAGLPAVSAHVVVAAECFSGGRAPALLDELQSCLAGHFDVEHSTFQLEPVEHTAHETGTH